MQRMILLLKRSPEQQQALDRLIASLHDQGSPNFHRWLSPQDFGARFGLAPQDLDTIQSWLRSHGLTVNRISRSRGAVEFSGSALQVQEAFRTEIHHYVVNNESHYANAVNPQIPKALAPVIGGVLSLHNFYSRPSAHLAGKGSSRHQVQSATQPALTFYGGGTTPLHVLVADDLQTIYNAKPLFAETASIDGSGQSIAILARSNILASDFQQYRALFQPFARMDALSVVVDGVDPGPTYDADQVESTADVEYAGAMVPNAKLLLVVSDSTFNTDGIALSALYAVENNLAPVISLSYNACEAELAASGNAFYSALWEQAAAQGITVVVSTGDSGAAACDSPAPNGDAGDPAAAIGGLAVSGLASTAFNLAVGGTQLADNAGNSYWAAQNNAAFGSALSYIPEQAWNESCSPADCAGQANLYAGGGGASNCTAFTVSGSNLKCTGHYAKPAWQSAPGVYADGARDIPDLSLSAAQHDGYVLCLFYSCAVETSSGNFYFYVVGGTSLSTPEFAGIMTLVDQQTGTPQGQAASTLYALASAQSAILPQCNASNPGASFSSCIFQDVTQGSNSVPCAGGSPGCSASQAGTYGTLAGYSAAPGYDAVAGLGSVNVANLVHQWATAARAATATLLTATPSTITHGQAVNLGVTVSAESGGGTPGGDIDILTSSANPTAQSAGYATLSNGVFNGSVTSLPGGSYQLTARYAGNPGFAPSLSPGVAITVRPEASSVTLEPNAVLGSKIVTTLSQLPYGSLVALDFQVAGVSGKGVPTGSVSFVSTPQAGTPSTQSFVLNSLGMAEWVGVESALGNFTYSAAYSGDASFLPAISQTLAFQVVPASTTVSLTASAASLPSTAQLQLTVNIQTESYASLSPTGTVTLLAGSSVLASAPVYGSTDPSTGLAVAQAEFSLPASTLKNATNIFTVTYNGDSNYKNASSSPLTVTVVSAMPAGAPTVVDLAVSTIGGGSTAASGQPVTLRAAVTDGGQPVSGGSVTFFNANSTLATVQVVGPHPALSFTTGTATIKLRLPIASNSISARYNGQGATYQPALSAPITVSVTGSAPSISTLTASENAQNAANYDLTLSVAANSPTPPPGTANFHNNTSGSSLGQLNLQPATPPVALAAAQQIAIDGLSAADGVAVLAADLNGDGIPDAVTVNGAANSVSVLLGNGDGSFHPATQYAVDPAPTKDVIVDVNQDGIPDIVTVSSGGAISVLLGNGDGTFQPKRTFPAVSSPVAIVAGDFNGDGIPDLAVASGNSSFVSVLLGNSDGTFLPAQNFVAAESATGIATADFNSDGNLDLLVAGANGLFLLLGNGNGSFRLSSTQPTTLPVLAPVVADFNGDGAPDIAAPLASDPAQFLLLLGNGDGSFQPAQLYGPGAFTSSTINSVALAAADLNGSGIPQLIQMLARSAGENASQALYVYPNNRNGTFNSPYALTLPQWSTNPPNALALADLNGDGILDILSTTTGASSSALTSALMQSVSAATLSNQSLGAAPQTIQASYAPSSGSYDLPGTSNTLTLGQLVPTTITITPGYQTVLGNSSTCVLPASPTLYYGYDPCFWLQVAPTLPRQPTGTLTLTASNPQGGLIPSGPWQLLPNGNGVIVPWNSSLGDAGAYSFTAVYSGDSVFQGSASAALSLPLATVQLTLNLAAPANLPAGDAAVLSLTSSGSGWGGLYYLDDAISWYDGTTLLGTQFHANSSTFTTPPLTAGSHAFTAKYAGRTGAYGTLDVSPAISAPSTTAVLPGNPNSGGVTLNLTPLSPSFAQPVTMTATVTAASGAPQTAGTVTFLDGNTPLATLPLLPSTAAAPGTAALKLPLAVGPHTLSVRYNGSTRLLSSPSTPSVQTNAAQLSAPQTLTVAPAAPTSIQLTAAVNAVNSSAYDFTSALFVSGFVPPGGSITFADTTANATLGVAVVNASALTPAFGTPLSIPLAGTASLVAAADFNADGITDLAVADAVNSSVHILRGSGNGSFAPQTDYSLGSDIPTAMLIADVNHDGIPDIVIATTGNNIDILLGNRDGTFQPVVSAPLPIVPAAIALGDLNGDGILDLVIAGESGTTTLATLLGNGDGTFQASLTYTTAMLYSNASIVLADFNGDGVLDVILQTNGYEVDEWLGAGDGTLQNSLDVSGVYGPIAAADLTGSGIADLIFAPSVGLAALQLGRGDGSFIPPRYYSSGAALNSAPGGPIAIADFNGDGIPDIIVPGMLFIGARDGTLPSAIPYSGGFSIVADLNGDGLPDLVTIAGGALTVQYGGSQVNAVLNAVALPGLGMHSVQAAYTPAQNVPYLGSTSNPLQLPANPAGATTSSAVPLLLSLSPASASAGGAAFTLTVSGANFTPASVLLWNGELRPTSYVTTTQLTAAISAADVATAATNRITVANLSPNPATSSALPFAVNNTQAAAIILGSSIFNAADSSGDHALALTGIGFVDAAAVQWNGASLAATCISSSQISAIITAADFATRPAALTVSNPTGTLSRFNLP